MKQMHIFWNTYIVSLYVDDCALSMCENAYKKEVLPLIACECQCLCLCVLLSWPRHTVYAQRHEVSSPLLLH